eukprot:Pgem_evm1s19660
MFINNNYSLTLIDLAWLHYQSAFMKLVLFCISFCLAWLINTYFTNGIMIPINSSIQKRVFA